MRITEGALEIPVELIEVRRSTEACDYVAEHYQKLKRVVGKCGIHPNKCDDLLHDVWISLATNELDGEGFDMNYANSRTNCQILDVSQFVIGRIKLYAKNAKYRTDVSETATTYTYENKGSKLIKSKVNVVTYSASFDETDLDKNDSFQKGYAMASVADSTDDIVDSYSLREQIDYCIDICERSGLNIVHLFKNIDTLSELIGLSREKKKKSESVFGAITELAEKHNDFADALLNVLQFSARNRAAFDLVLEAY